MRPRQRVTPAKLTEHKRAEHEAAQAYVRLTDSIECIPDGFALYDADDRLVWCNERYREVYPKHADAIVPGSSFEDMLRDGVARGEFSAAIGREEEWIAERLRSHADPLGPIEQELTDGRWLRVEERRTREGGIVGLRTDITAIKRAERSAADAKARLGDAIESISDGFILYDAEERLVLCNRKYRELNPSFQDILVPGVPLENVIRASAASEGAPLEIDDIDSWTRMRLEEYRAGTGSREILHADGRWILASERRMRNGGMVSIRIDISEIKRAMEAIRLSEEKFSKAFRAGPDSIVITRMSDGIIIDSNDRFLSRVGHTLEDIVGRPMSDVVTWVNPEDRASLMNGISTTGESTDLEADFRYADGRLVNCLVTARTIEVEGEMCDYVMLAVTDSGVGVAPDMLEHVFEPFFTTKEVGQGSGLGLSMVYGFANQSGGYVSIDSEIGRGTTVKVFLPRAWTSDQWAERQLAEEEPLGWGESVLLVEDETGVRMLTATLLGRLGYAVIEARDGGPAIATLESDARVDLLLSDVVLLGAMSGPKIAEKARRLRAGIKVLFMSGYPDQVLRSHGPLVRGAEVLRKPFRRIHLAQKVRKTLDVDRIADPRSSKQDTRLPLT